MCIKWCAKSALDLYICCLRPAKSFAFVARIEENWFRNGYLWICMGMPKLKPARGELSRRAFAIVLARLSIRTWCDMLAVLRLKRYCALRSVSRSYKQITQRKYCEFSMVISIFQWVSYFPILLREIAYIAKQKYDPNPMDATLISICKKRLKSASNYVYYFCSNL